MIFGQQVYDLFPFSDDYRCLFGLVSAMLHSGLVGIADHLDDVVHLLRDPPSFPPEFLHSQIVFFFQPEQNLLEFKTRAVGPTRFPIVPDQSRDDVFLFLIESSFLHGLPSQSNLQPRHLMPVLRFQRELIHWAFFRFFF